MREVSPVSTEMSARISYSIGISELQDEMDYAADLEEVDYHDDPRYDHFDCEIEECLVRQEDFAAMVSDLGDDY